MFNIETSTWDEARKHRITDCAFQQSTDVKKELIWALVECSCTDITLLLGVASSTRRDKPYFNEKRRDNHGKTMKEAHKRRKKTVWLASSKCLAPQLDGRTQLMYHFLDEFTALLNMNHAHFRWLFEWIDDFKDVSFLEESWKRAPCRFSSHCVCG